jgi:hypothetical protein
MFFVSVMPLLYLTEASETTVSLQSEYFSTFGPSACRRLQGRSLIMKVEMIRLTRPSPSPMLTAILQRRLWGSYSGSQKVNIFTHRPVSNQLFLA